MYDKIEEENNGLESAYGMERICIYHTFLMGTQKLGFADLILGQCFGQQCRSMESLL